MRLSKNVISGTAAVILVPMALVGSYAEQELPKLAPDTSDLPARPNSPDPRKATDAIVELKAGAALRYTPLPAQTQTIALDRRGELLVAPGGGLEDPMLVEQKAWLNGPTKGSLSRKDTQCGANR